MRVIRTGYHVLLGKNGIATKKAPTDTFTLKLHPVFEHIVEVRMRL